MVPNRMMPELETLCGLVSTAAREELLSRFRRVERAFKPDGSVITDADLAMQTRLQESLSTHWPEVAFLGEEMAEDEQERLLADGSTPLWVLDPLDGTSNFSAGLPFFSVSLALVVGGEVVLGVVYDPVRDECFTARKGGGAWCNGEPLALRDPGLSLARCIACVDFKRLDAPLARRLAEEPPYSSQRSLGSVALDWCWLAAGRLHVYLHGRQKLWDYAAGSLVLAEAGGQSVTLEGEPVFRTAVAPRSAVAALGPELFSAWRKWLRVPAAGEA